MRVQLIGDMSGTRNGQQWPPRFSVMDLPDDEAVRLCDQKMARPVVDAAEESHAVVEPVEDRRVLAGPAADEVPTAPAAVESARSRRRA